MSDCVLPLSKFIYLCYHLATFHVQELNVIDLSNGLVSVTCVFAEGSLADGCSVEFINEQNESWEHVIYKTLRKDSVNEVITIPNGIYHTVNVYDIVNGVTSDVISIIYTIDFIFDIPSSYVETVLPSPSTTSSYMQPVPTSKVIFFESTTILQNSPTPKLSDPTG